MITAEYVKDCPKFYHAEMFKLSEPYHGYNYIIASAVCHAWAHETYIFGCDENGEVTEWGELEGSQKYTTSIDTVLAEAGFVVVR